MTDIPRTESTTVGEWPDSVSRAVTGSVVVGYGVALAGFVIAFTGSDLSFWKAFPDGLVVLTLLAVPPTTAMLSHPKHPLMLLPAGLMGLLGLFGTLSILGLPLVVLGLIWLWAYLKLAPSGRWINKAATILVLFLWLSATAALWIHLDPVCEQRLRDGTVIDVDPVSRGFESGWAWEVSSSSSGSSGPISEEVVFEACTSNALVLWEALSAMVLSAVAVLVASSLARPSADQPQPPRGADLTP